MDVKLLMEMIEEVMDDVGDNLTESFLTYCSFGS